MARFATIPAPPSVGDLLGVERITEPSTTGFVALDDRLQRGTPGCILVRVPTAEMIDAVQAHAARRLGAVGLVVVRARAGSACPLFKDVAERLGLTIAETDPAKFAERLASALRAVRATLVATMPVPGTWDHQIASELARAETHLVLVGDGASLDSDSGIESFEIARNLDATERLRWTTALTDEAFSVLAHDEIATLEGWWKRARFAPPDVQPPPLTNEAAALLSLLDEAGRAWPLQSLDLLSPSEVALEELVATGRARIDGAFVVADQRGSELDTDQLRALASALETTFPGDPWALVHAGELRVRTNDPEAARTVFERGIALAQGTVRRELIAKWLEATQRLDAERRAPLLTSAAKLALDAGDSEEALRLAQLAAASSPMNPDLALLVGRAAMATGDLIAARVALTRAQSLSDNAAEVNVELAELAYLTGDHDRAARLLEGLESTVDAGIRLGARSIQGKILLARSELDAAERHFAEDAWAASVEGLATASRRARLNRAVALLLKGQIGEARVLLETVRQEGEAAHEVQSQAYALENLSAVAVREHAYGQAMAYADEALALRRAQGDRLRIVRLLVNVTTLRRMLGLFDHAEHAVRFGRRVLGPGMPFDAAPRFGIAASRLALDCNRLDQAQREAERALAEGETARERDLVIGEALRLLTRVAIEEGNVARARAFFERASTFGKGEYTAWELSYLEALLLRAEGRLDDEFVARAIANAEALNDEECTRLTLLLAIEHYRAEGRPDQARTYLERALMHRDRMAGSLSGDVREAFLRRPDVAQLTRLGELLTVGSSDCDSEPPPPTRRITPPIAARPQRELIGEDPAIRSLRAAIRRVARSDATVLIRGESGTGKELVAEALHRASERSNGPLVTVNCAALVETLLLSELFGHEKGAFTGAAARRRGRFELAEGGTLFLDEIGDISPRTQVALLRVLQEKTYERVGGTTALRANVRIVCATHRDLRAMVERGEFREDLYYRLRGITLEVPALRARIGDLPAIADNLLSRIATERSESTKALAPAATELLQRHRWPGNVRELENALRAASLFADGSTIEARDFTENVDDLRPLSTPSVIPMAAPSIPTSRATLRSIPAPADESGEIVDSDFADDDESALPPGETGATAVAYACVRQGSVSLGDLKRQIERDCVARALAETKGNITRAAALLGMKRPRLSQLVKQYGLAAVSEGSS